LSIVIHTLLLLLSRLVIAEHVRELSLFVFYVYFLFFIISLPA